MKIHLFKLGIYKNLLLNKKFKINFYRNAVILFSRFIYRYYFCFEMVPTHVTVFPNWAESFMK